MKKLLRIERGDAPHWVGDGFPVRTLFAYSRGGAELSPFLLLDHAGPLHFPPRAPGEARRGVGEHPHRGFETVTIVYAGEVEHRDSSGGGGRIGPGDVQWMTAASGLVHEELHGEEWSRHGGTLEMAQLWVNLPAEHKLAPPRYQSIEADSIPRVELQGDRGVARVIAGAFGATRGPASTFTPMNVWDVRPEGDAPIEIALPDGHTALLVVLQGSVRVEGQQVSNGGVAIFARSGSSIAFDSCRNAKLLLLAGEPIAEPIVGQGPFVMNTREEIRQAIEDFSSGRMGRL